MRKLNSFFLFVFIGIVLSSCSEDESTITVQGNATVKVPVDYVSVNVGFADQGANISELEKNSYQTMIKLKNILQDQWNLPDSLIQTSRSSINEQFNSRSQQTYYRFNQNMTVVLDSLELYDTLRRDLIKAGATQCRINNFGTYNKKAGKQKALNKAYKEAHEKAEQLAENADFTIGKPQKISSSGKFNISEEQFKLKLRGSRTINLSSQLSLESSIVKKYIEVEADVDVIFSVE